jgi:hypothetical protein
MNDETIISLAIDKSQRSRYRELLANPKKRRRLLDKLNHNPPLDSRHIEWFSSFDKALASIQVENQNEAYILSSAAEIDGKSMSFGEAVKAVYLYGWGTIICVSPLLAVYYGEQGERAAIIRKRA